MLRKSVSAIECSQNGKKFILTTLNSKVLKEMCFVSRKKEDPLKGFQRLLNKKRARDIATYLDKENGIIPSVLVISAQDNTRIRYDNSTLKLSFEIVEEGFLVIDGQHRLYGLVEAENDYDMPVVLFSDLKTTDEVKLFIDINTTQKGVPSALILDIKNQAGTETKIEERQRELFNKINEESVIAGYLLANESKAGKISRTVFNGSTRYIFENSAVSEMGDDIIYQTIKNYLEAVDHVFKMSGSKDARITKTVLFKSVMTIFNEICEKCLIKYNNVKVESFTDYMEALRDLNFEEYTGTNKATENRIVSDIRSLLKETVQLSGDMF